MNYKIINGADIDNDILSIKNEIVIREEKL